MNYDVFANIMAMYPITPTKKIAELFGVEPSTIKQMANAMGVYKLGRKHSRAPSEANTVVYNARTNEVSLLWGRDCRISKRKSKW